LDNKHQEIFFHFSQLPRGIRPRLEEVYEFTLAQNLRGDGLMATEIEVI
jgi:cold shock CspA family protein